MSRALQHTLSHVSLWQVWDTTRELGFSKPKAARLFRDTWALTLFSSLMCGWSLLVLHLVQELREPGVCKHFLTAMHKVRSSPFFWLRNIIKILFLPQPFSTLSERSVSVNCMLCEEAGIKEKLSRGALPSLGLYARVIHGYMIASVYFRV